MTSATTDIARLSDCIASFPVDVVGQIVIASSDLCLLIGEDLVVQNIVTGFALQDLDCASWQGASLRTLVGPEGQRKIDLLWSAGAKAIAGWRHLNFRTRGLGTEVPLLVQRIAARDGRSVLVCRDLRPAVRMQQQFNRAMVEIEQSYEDAMSAPVSGATEGNENGSARDARSVHASALVQQAFCEIGKQPVAQIVSQTARVLEEMCIREAYAQCDYDMDKTAQTLGLDPDDLAQRMVFFQRKA